MIDITRMNAAAPIGLGGIEQQGRAGDVVSGFGEVLNKAVNSVSQKQNEAKELSVGLVSGQHSNIHETMIAVEKSSISFKLMTKMNQKALEAYQEVMRMQL